MNAVKLYVSTARLVLENDHFDYALCKAISHSFATLELSLSCTVCRSLLADPHSPSDTTCQHHVCQRCLGGLKKLKPSCSWCKDWSKYTRNSQLLCLLSCYRGLCHYVKCSNLLADPNSLPEPEKRVVLGVLNRGTQLNRGTPLNRATQLGTTQADSAAVGCELKLKIPTVYSMKSSRRSGEHRRFRQFGATAATNDHRTDSSAANSSDESGGAAGVSQIKVERRRSPEYVIAEKPTQGDQSKEETHKLRLRRVNSSEESAASDAEMQPLYSVAFASTRSKLILKRRNVPKPRRETSHPKPENGGQQQPAVAYALQSSDYLQMSGGLLKQSSKKRNHLKMERNSKGRFSKSKHYKQIPACTCKCGIAATQPGKLTCCGQRCACYMQKKACSSCRCRGCRNPHLMEGVKMLGKFLKNKDKGEAKFIGNTPSYVNSGSANCVNQVLSTLPTNSSSVADIS